MNYTFSPLPNNNVNTNWQNKCSCFNDIYNTIRSLGVSSVKDIPLWLENRLVSSLFCLVHSSIYFKVPTTTTKSNNDPMFFNNAAMTSKLINSAEYSTDNSLVYDILSDICKYSTLDWFIFKSSPSAHAIRMLKIRVSWLLCDYIKKNKKTQRDFPLIVIPNFVEEDDPDVILSNSLNENSMPLNNIDKFIESSFAYALLLDMIYYEISKSHGDRILALISDFVDFERGFLIYSIETFGYDYALKELIEYTSKITNLDLSFLLKTNLIYKKPHNTISLVDFSKWRNRAYEDTKKIFSKNPHKYN